jgi:putative ABC transport system substrate-binding protein
LIVPAPSDYAARTDALRSGLRELGYVEGVNARIELRSAQGRFDRLPLLAAELVQQDVDVMVVAGTPVIRAVKQVTQTTPVVIAAVGDAVAGGHVESLSRPGGNITGSTYFAPELATKQLELLKEVLPQEIRVAVLFNPSNPAAKSTVQALDLSAKSLKLEMREFAVRDPSDFDDAFATIAGNHHRMGLIVDDPITISNARALADLSLKYRLAAGANFIEYAEAGGLMAYGVNLSAMWRRAAYFVDKILKGAHPGEIPVERATKFDLVINRTTAAALQVTIVPSLLLRAERVIG